MQRGQGDFEAPRGDDEQAAVPFTPGTGPARSPIDEVLERNISALRAIEGVAGVGHGRTPTGDDAVVVHVGDASVRDRLPGDVEGYPVEVIVIPGGFDIQDQRGGPSAT